MRVVRSEELVGTRSANRRLIYGTGAVSKEPSECGKEKESGTQRVQGDTQVAGHTHTPLASQHTRGGRLSFFLLFSSRSVRRRPKRK